MGASNDRPLLKAVKGYDDLHAGKIIRNLEHIARWQQIESLNNPESKISNDAVQIAVRHKDTDEKWDLDKDFTLHYEYANGEWQKPTFELELRLGENQKQPLHCALLYLDGNGSFSIRAVALLPVYGQWLDPKGDKAGSVVKVLPAYEGQPIRVRVEDDLWEQGITETQATIKLIASTEAFDASSIEQKALENWRPPIGAKEAGTEDVNRSLGGTLDNFLDYAATHTIDDPVEPKLHNEWFSKSITLTIVRPQESEEISDKDSKKLSNQVVVEPHPYLKAYVSLESSNQVTRGLKEAGFGGKQTPPILTQDYTISQPFTFTSSRGHDEGFEVHPFSKQKIRIN